jgi:hypothetical protein
MSRTAVKSVQQLLADAQLIVLAPNATDDMRRTALQVTYDLGYAEGKIDGGRRMADELMAAFKAIK